jgi:CBS domain-containing protein
MDGGKKSMPMRNESARPADGRHIRDIMTEEPARFETSASVSEAARAMRDRGVGAVLVTENGELRGLLTDRDIAVRAVADGKDPGKLKVGEICSREIHTLSPEETLDRAVELMRQRSIRRVPVVDGTKPIGIVSLGDLAIHLDPKSVLGNISAAQPTR